MTMKQAMMLSGPIVLMLLTALGLMGNEVWLAGFAQGNQKLYLFLGHLGLAAPYVAAGILGLVFLLSANGSLDVRFAGSGVLVGGLVLFLIAAFRESMRLHGAAPVMPLVELLRFTDLYSMGGAASALLVGLFGLKVGLHGNAAFQKSGPRRVSGRRAIHGESNWMASSQIARLMPPEGGIVLGERTRVDRDHTAGVAFKPQSQETWGQGGKAPLIAFDQSFGSTHGIVFAGSGGFKTTSVVIPTCLRYSGSMIVLDPSTEIAPMVSNAREALGHDVIRLDPKHPETGFNVLDWIGQYGSSKEEDVSTIAAWLMSEKPRLASGTDDFFRANAEQLITGVIAHVVFADPATEPHERTLRTVREILTKPEENLKELLTEIYSQNPTRFVK